jgi:steroid delta-isomerase-like uncharacterized protein
MPTFAQRRLIDQLAELYRTGDPSIIDDLFAANRIEQAKRGIASWRAAFPDFRVTVHDVIAEGDKVVVRWTGHGTHLGGYSSETLGTIPPTGKTFEAQEIHIYQLHDGRIIADWEVWDMLGAMQQLGVIPRSDSVSKPMP